MSGLTIIVASVGRDTLADTLDSFAGQLEPEDQVLIDVNRDAPFGHKARNRMMPLAKSENGLCFMDDDDVYTPGALKVMRARFRTAPESIHIFRLDYPGMLLWQDPVIRPANVSTQMFIVPKELAVQHRWSDRYEGDYDFISAAASGQHVIWHEEVIAIYGGRK